MWHRRRYFCWENEEIVKLYDANRGKKVGKRFSSHLFVLFTLFQFSVSGQQLVNWFISSFSEDHYLRMILAPQDLKILVAQFCTHMLAAGVLRQIPDKNAPVASLFRVRPLL
ncbi:hypothetical protein RUM44_013857 [Polyplax serrata]|uniref:Uncharacterized protein n=1 Tax=Polyplax serrata TaxID=468196 RepID=A0ABR1BIX0_POLSC